MTDLEPRTTLLEIEGLTLHYGAAQALFGIDLRVAAGETVAIVTLMANQIRSCKPREIAHVRDLATYP